MDEEVRNHLEMHWHGQEHVTGREERNLQTISVTLLKHLIAEKRVDLENGASPRQDLITCLLSIRDGKNEQVISEKEIIHNVMLIMVAGYDTSSALLTFLMRLFANDPAVYAAVLQEQEEIAKNKPNGKLLTWEDLDKMKYTWKVAMETLTVSTNLRWLPESCKRYRVLWVTDMTQMDDTIFPEPSKFDQNRFENPASLPPYCFIPFGG
ncbi:Inositol-1,4,5-trisphosphate 5-phosphatase 4 isoform 1 [Hibiscus syriacus]|uniref:Inositol-1,4,5-trisphosphate 5-phosphatase 4 isoform 1 n=1 Tax=Hibiscus syriacus TaxID=106335 RepID=A0A6A2WDU5_HIBSY|nr:Inositol-1,4,5-trisphosphate 5-phosphatase 4 isoform 1 [Hibiscus syriacus]